MAFNLYANGKKINEDYPLAKLAEEEIGVFESLRTYGQNIFRAEEHLKRLAESAKTVGFSLPPISKLSEELNAAVKAYFKEYPESGDLFLRLTLNPESYFIMVGEKKHSANLYEQGIALKTSAVKRSLSNSSPPEVKTSSYQNAVFATLEVSADDTYEWVFLDQNGFVTEVRIGNLFIIKDGKIFTPPLLGILNGVTRKFVIECAFQAGIEVKEVPMTRHEIYNAGEAFLTNTSWEILPVRELDRRRIGSSVPGEITKKLQNIFREKVREECP